MLLDYDTAAVKIRTNDKKLFLKMAQLTDNVCRRGQRVSVCELGHIPIGYKSCRSIDNIWKKNHHLTMTLSVLIHYATYISCPVLIMKTIVSFIQRVPVFAASTSTCEHIWFVLSIEYFSD